MPQETSWRQEEQAYLREITRLGCVACRLQSRGFHPVEAYYIQRRTAGALGAFGLCGPHHAQYLGAVALSEAEKECWGTLIGSEEELIALADTLLALKRIPQEEAGSELETGNPDEDVS
jgi:hypothetical protein